MSKNQITKIVKLYIQKVETAGIPVKTAYVFGSNAKGGAKKGSDIDICIVSSAFGRDRQKERIKLMNLRDDRTDMIEPHPFAPKDFQLHNPFVHEILKTGLRI